MADMPPPASPPHATSASDPTAYEQVPYDSRPFPQSHPSRLFTVATLFGLGPVPIDQCRVLELGCAAGGNLLPMADNLPGSEFIGVDYSPRQINDGLSLLQQLNLPNAKLLCRNIMEIGPDFGQFDYIIAHGVFSWVPPDVQEKLLEICTSNLSPNGIVFLSYNVYPGWHVRGLIRDMMLYHARRFTTPQIRAQQSRAVLDFMAKSVSQEDRAYAMLLQQEAEGIRQRDDFYLVHEYLDDVNQPMYFSQFVDRIKSRRLNYVGDAFVSSMVAANAGLEVNKTLQQLASDQIQREQYMDFLRNRMFRQSLLCHEHLSPNWSVNLGNLEQLHLASAAQPLNAHGQLLHQVHVHDTHEVAYASPAGRMTTRRPIFKAALELLRRAYPGTLPFAALAAQAWAMTKSDNSFKDATQGKDFLAQELLHCLLRSDLIELYGMAISVARTPSEKPLASPLARRQAALGYPIANRRHELIILNEFDRQVLTLLDGETDRAALAAKLKEAGSRITLQRDGKKIIDAKEMDAAVHAILEPTLQNLARQALLIA